MPKILIVFHSTTGRTELMAGFIREGIESEGVEADVRGADEVNPEDFLGYDGIIIGSPTYYGSMSWDIKKLLDDASEIHGELDGKIGGAFSSADNIGGGAETAVMNINHALLVQGMIIQGNPRGSHYGPVLIGDPDGQTAASIAGFGERIAKLAKKLSV